MTIEASQQASDGTFWKLIRESSTFMAAPIETKGRTNTETGAITVEGRPPGLYRRDVYFPVSEVGGISKTNRELSMTMVLHASIPSMKVRDFLVESNSAIYLCDTYFVAKVTGHPDLLATVVTPHLGTNDLPQMSSHLLWHARFGSYSELKSARITGSQSGSNLLVEVTSLLGENKVISSNRFIDGQWVVSESKH